VIDILASDVAADIWQKTILRCNIISFIETINEFYAQSHFSACYRADLR